MAIVDITEYEELAVTRRGITVMAGQEPAKVNQQIAVSGASAQSTAFGDTTRLIRVHSDVACRIAISASPVASAASMRLAAGAAEYLGVAPGLKLAVISTT